jgi:hypothetical protein
MKEVIINQCDFCKKVSFYKSNIRQHEKICFYNPATRSCATCLWFSPLIIQEGFPIECYLGKIDEVPEGSKIKLFTQCEKWMDKKIYFDNETCENQDEMEEELSSGQIDYFKDLLEANEKDAMRKSFSKEVWVSPDPVIKLFKSFVNEPKL